MLRVLADLLQHPLALQRPSGEVEIEATSREAPFDHLVRADVERFLLAAIPRRLDAELPGVNGDELPAPFPIRTEDPAMELSADLEPQLVRFRHREEPPPAL